MTTMLSFSSFLPLLLLLALTSTLPLISSQACNKADMATLLGIKNSLGNPADLNSWDAARAADCCTSWRGVGCGANGRVTSLGIFYSNASGTIPPSIGDLSGLTTINLNNLLNLVGPIPITIAKLPSLTQITISNTALSGNIPAFLCNLPKVSYIDLSGNQLTGSIPPCLMSRVDKKSPPTLNLHQNQLTGQIPTSFANVNFATLDLSRNQLSGDASFLFRTANSAADTINLSWNQLEFDFSSVQFPPSLHSLDLNHNKIRGRIPQQITKLAKLTYLDVSYNQLCGPIPNIKESMQLPLQFQHNKCLCGAPLSPCRSLRI